MATGMNQVDQVEQSNWAVFGDTGGTDTNWSSPCENDTPPSLLMRSTDNGEGDGENDFEDWQDFDSTHKQLSMNNRQKPTPPTDRRNNSTPDNDKTSSNPVKLVMKSCFPITALPDDDQLQQSLEDINNDRYISELRTTSVSLTNFNWSRCLIKDQYFLAMLALEQKRTDEGDGITVGNEVDLSGFDQFDWSTPVEDQSDCAPLTTSRHDSITSADSGGLRFSPDDKFQEMFRSTTTRLDSPIELEFDHSKAVLGLSMLPSVDLITMRNEMTGKVSKLSNELVTSLQTRDILQLEVVTKNRLIQAMLKVQESKHAIQQNNELSSSIEPSSNSIEASMTRDDPGQPDSNGSTGDEQLNRLKQKRRSRSRSLQHLSRSLIAKAKSLRTVEEDKASNEVLMRVVIPYKQEINSGWSIPVLKQWTKILQAMADKSPNVSSLISDYLSSVIDSNSAQFHSGPQPDSSSQSDSSSRSDSSPHSSTNGPGSLKP